VGTNKYSPNAIFIVVALITEFAGCAKAVVGQLILLSSGCAAAGGGPVTLLLLVTLENDPLRLNDPPVASNEDMTFDADEVFTD
jgi:hypothetical protein